MMKLEFEDPGFLKGHVLVVVKQPGKRPVVWYEDPNVVVDVGRIRIAKLLAGESTDTVDAMIVGNGGASPPNNISPTAPSKLDTALLGRIGASPLEPGQSTTDADATQPVSVIRSINTVRFDATFSSDLIDHRAYPDFGSTGGGANLGLNAIYVSELGLIVSAASDELLARVTFAPIQFQNGLSTSITVQWSITIL
jgi:hypothetical protein